MMFCMTKWFPRKAHCKRKNINKNKNYNIGMPVFQFSQYFVLKGFSYKFCPQNHSTKEAPHFSRLLQFTKCTKMKRKNFSCHIWCTVSGTIAYTNILRQGGSVLLVKIDTPLCHLLTGEKLYTCRILQIWSSGLRHYLQFDISHIYVLLITRPIVHKTKVTSRNLVVKRYFTSNFMVKLALMAKQV